MSTPTLLQVVSQLTIGAPSMVSADVWRGHLRVIPRHGGDCATESGRRPSTRLLRRILIAIGLVLAVLILAVVAIYAVAFIILAPMMQ